MKKVLIILAILFLNFAYSLNSGDGCSNLGVMYVNGKGVRKDTSKALEYFGKACDLKSDEGCQNYARLKQ
ncbi:TPA: sel1 repeat family protein [Campylobacter lari]|nr:sel1 repeat family protein [Campylobacter lari]